MAAGGHAFAQSSVAAGEALVWGYDFQAVQTRPGTFQIQIVRYDPVPGEDLESKVDVFIRERDVTLVPAQMLSLPMLGYEEAKLEAPKDCWGWPSQYRKVIYQAEWKRPEFGKWDLYCEFQSPYAGTTNLPKPVNLSLWMPLDGITGILPGSSGGFAGLPGIASCPDGLPSAGFDWGAGANCTAKLQWEPLYGTVPSSEGRTEEESLRLASDPAARMAAVPIFKPLEQQVGFPTGHGKLAKQGQDWTQLDFLAPGGRYVLAAGATLDCKGEQVGIAKRLWVTGL